MDKLAVDQPNYASYKRELESEGSAIIASSFRGCVRNGTEPRNPRSARVLDRQHIGASRRSRRARNDERVYFPTHFGGRFSENAFGPSI